MDMFSKTVKDNDLTIDMDVTQMPRSISQYIQAWHNQIWEHGFVGFFRGKESYTKTKAFLDQKQTDLLPKKEKNKILNQRTRVKERAKAKADREAQKAKDKAIKDAERQLKKGGRSRKSKAGDASSPTLVLPEASIGSMSQNPYKRDSSFVQLSASRLQQCTSPAF